MHVEMKRGQENESLTIESLTCIPSLELLTVIFSFFLSYYCSFVFLSVPWLLLEKPAMEVSQIQFNFWIFFSNALCALALNFSIFLVIGRTGAVTIRVAGVLKDWILIALSTVIFPESIITRLNIIGYAIGSSALIFSGSINLQLHIVHS